MNKIDNFPSVICITTDNAKDRLNNFIKQCEYYNISNYNIFCFKPYKEYNYTLTGEFIDKLQENSKGPVTSHIKALYQWYNNYQDDIAIVLEDDINLKTIDYWNFTWNEFYASLPEDWECIQLCNIRDNFDNVPMSFRRRINSDLGCQAYLVKREYIKKIIDKYYIDENTFHLEITNTKVYLDLNKYGIYNLFPIVEHVLFEGIGNVYNFSMFTEDVENTNSNFVLSQDDNHFLSYKYVLDWWKNIGKNLTTEDIFELEEKILSIILIKDNYSFEEYDYIMSLLPKNNRKILINSYTDDDLLNMDLSCDILIYRIFGMYPDKFKALLDKLKPKIMINISDEAYHPNNNIFNELGKYSQLYLRNYHHKDYRYTENTLHIPLGFCSGVQLQDSQKLKNISEKEYIWSWCGQFKSDRYEMIEEFKKIEKYKYSDNLERSEIADLYNNSIFVPCGRGNFVLDCFRLYEASSCGAIPVVVGSIEEIETTFKYEENPPWIFAETWEKARIACETLLNNKTILQDMQNNLILWWNNRINNIRKQISKIINDKNHTIKLKHIYDQNNFGEEWFTYPILYKTMVDTAKDNSKFVEIGCWKGKSAAYMAVEIANSNKNIDFYCIDTWEGSVEHRGYSELNTLYDIFNTNMLPLKKYYKLIRTTSLEGSKQFEDNSLDFVFIDASHEYQDVKDDINAWLPKVKPGGVLAGHDYYIEDTSFNGVRLAVDELLNNIILSEKCWIYNKL